MLMRGWARSGRSQGTGDARSNALGASETTTGILAQAGPIRRR